MHCGLAEMFPLASLIIKSLIRLEMLREFIYTSSVLTRQGHLACTWSPGAGGSLVCRWSHFTDLIFIIPYT